MTNSVSAGLRSVPLSMARLSTRDVRCVKTRSHGTLAARVTGKGPPVVLLHGVTDNRGTWHTVQSLLADAFECHAIDLPGHGLSDIPDRAQLVAEQAAAVDGYLEAVGLPPCVIVGSSMGGGVALGLAAHYADRVRSVVTLGSIGAAFSIAAELTLLRYPFVAEQMARFARTRTLRKTMYERTLAPRFRAPDGAVERYWSGWFVEGRAQYMRAQLRRLDNGEPYPWLPSVRAKVIVVHGELDPVVPVRVGHAVAARLVNANKRVLRGVGHLPQVEVPAIVAAAVREAAAG